MRSHMRMQVSDRRLKAASTDRVGCYIRSGLQAAKVSDGWKGGG